MQFIPKFFFVSLAGISGQCVIKFYYYRQKGMGTQASLERTPIALSGRMMGTTAGEVDERG
jgi:hypothetical protein